MSGREWKPGDVAMVTAANRSAEYRAFYDGKTWRDVDTAFCVDEPTTHRPLIVIDLAPEMDDVGGAVVAQWLREAAKADGRRGILHGFAHLARQIEAQSAPPKPDEPTGLGAVVEDADGERWVRVGETFRACTGANRGRYRRYAGAGIDDSIAAVRVLSEGVTP